MLRFRMGKKLDRLSGTLGNLLKAQGMLGRLSEYRIFAQWEKSVGAGIAVHARPQALRGKKLFVIVDSPAWMQQLSLLKPEIIEKVNRSLGKNAISEITLAIGTPEPYPGKASQPEENVQAVPLTREEHERIEGYLSEVRDPDLRQAMRRVIEKDFLSRKRKNR